MAAEIRDMGFECRDINEVYGVEAAQWVQDPRWIRRCGNEKWAIITRDYLTLWRHVIIESQGRVFRVARSAGTETKQIDYVRANINKIAQRAGKAGHYIDRVDADDVKRVWP